MDTILSFLQRQVVDELILNQPPQESYSLLRRFIVTTIFFAIGGQLLYFSLATASYLYYFKLRKNVYFPKWTPSPKQVREEIKLSVVSMTIMAVMTSPIVMLEESYGKFYHDISERGIAYFVFSIFLFIAFSDSLIYWIHRGLHHPSVYSYVHKPHHQFIETTPYSSHAFHPVDGFLQGLPYQLFVLIFPIHNWLHLCLFLFVNIWTVNIHDRLTMVSFFGLVNGAGHHNIHHLKNTSNYGQYLTLWDRLCGTFHEPNPNEWINQAKTKGKFQ
mmetsp:Transcript_2137/g.5004  ORF Transcript_2137/g.5004 Transcript_2137/m.5004 type:complete len:273 (+) Transcript_2137:123-941(+)